MPGAGAPGRARATFMLATRRTPPQRRTFCIHPWSGGFRAPRLAADFRGGKSSRGSAAALAGAPRQPWAVSGRDGCRAANLLASGGAPGIEVGFFAGRVDQEQDRKSVV